MTLLTGKTFPRGDQCPLPLAVSTLGIPECSDPRFLWGLFSTTGNVGNRNRWAGAGGEGTGLCPFRQTSQLKLSSSHADRDTVHVPGIESGVPRTHAQTGRSSLTTRLESARTTVSFPASNCSGCFRRTDLDKPQLQGSSQLPRPRSLQVIRSVGHSQSGAGPKPGTQVSCSQFLPPRAVPVLREREKDLGLLAMCP